MEGKNLLKDMGTRMQDEINYINNGEHIVIAVEINQYTKKYLESKGIYGFKNFMTGNIPIRINNNLVDFAVQFIREKKDKATEFIPYKEIGKKGRI